MAMEASRLFNFAAKVNRKSARRPIRRHRIILVLVITATHATWAAEPDDAVNRTVRRIAVAAPGTAPGQHSAPMPAMGVDLQKGGVSNVSFAPEDLATSLLKRTPYVTNTYAVSQTRSEDSDDVQSMATVEFGDVDFQDLMDNFTTAYTVEPEDCVENDGVNAARTTHPIHEPRLDEDTNFPSDISVQLHELPKNDFTEITTVHDKLDVNVGNASKEHKLSTPDAIIPSSPGTWNVYITNPVPAPQVPPPTIQPAPISIYNLPQTQRSAEDRKQERREQIASMVSDNILKDRSNVNVSQPIARISESVTSVQLLRDCEEHAISADRYLKRGAAFAAREEVTTAIRCLAGATDLQNGGTTATDAVEIGLNAIREAGDFLGRYGTIDSSGIARMVASHETEVLKRRDLSGLTPYAAADAYLDHARRNLTQAVAGSPQGPRLLMLLANAERIRPATDVDMSDAVALTCLRAAVGSNSNDPLLASELGYHALQAGHLDEARWALERSLSIQPSTAAYQNLIETHRLSGRHELASQLASRMPLNPNADKQSLLVTTVSPDTFAQLSPPVQSSSPAGTFATQQLGMQNLPTAQTVGNRTQHQPTQVSAESSAGPRTQATQHSGLSPNQQQPTPAAMHPFPSSGPSVLDRMAGAMKNVLR